MNVYLPDGGRIEIFLTVTQVFEGVKLCLRIAFTAFIMALQYFMLGTLEK